MDNHFPIYKAWDKMAEYDLILHYPRPSMDRTNNWKFI